MLRINIGRVLVAIAFISVFYAVSLQADVLPYFNNQGLLTVIGDERSQRIVPNGGVGILPALAGEYAEISTGVGTFARIEPLALRTSANFYGLRPDGDYWTFLFLAREDGSASVAQIKTTSLSIGAPACDISPCVPPTPFYAFVVIVHRASGSLSVIEAK